MNNYKQLPRWYPEMYKRGDLFPSEPISLPVVPLARALAWVMVGLLEVVLLFGVLQMTLGLGPQGEGPMPVPNAAIAPQAGF